MRRNSMCHALARQRRRNELWRAAAHACGSYEAFRASARAIERAVEYLLNMEAVSPR